MGFQFIVMFIDYFMDDVAYVRDTEVCMYGMICYIPGCICYGSENFGLNPTGWHPATETCSRLICHKLYLYKCICWLMSLIHVSVQV